MNFNDAWAEVYKKIPEENRLRSDDKDNVKNAKIMALMWSMFAVSKNVLDDIAYIGDNQQIISIPLQKSSTKKTAGKEKKPDKPEVEDNGKEQENSTGDTASTESE